jgi:flotillin
VQREKMNKKKVENTYLQQVLEEQEEVDRQLKKSRARLPEMSAPQAKKAKSRQRDLGQEKGRMVDYRVMGYLWWKSVIVPPNVYVIHTRRGHTEPIHIGMGISFGFNPFKDAFLVIPSAVQTILINAKCICQERQGILVQAYVQWIIDDIQTAYWKLDFSDPEDPMGIVNVQLREQAEAAIKDKVATLSIDEVLSDKQPIIEELTYRLRTVAEGSNENENSQGLGLKIVTVQIKEAIVSSTQLWENLQAPFRADRDKLARLAEIENTGEISDRERQDRLESETAELNVQSELEQLKSTKEREKYDREYAEESRRQQLEENATRQKIVEENTTARVRNEAQLELALQELELEQRRLAAEIEKVREQMQFDEIQAQQIRATVSTEIEVSQMRHLEKVAAAERELELDRRRRDIENDLSEGYVQTQLINQLPEIAQNLPVPKEQKTTIITTDGQDMATNSLLSFLASAFSLSQSFFKKEDSEVKERSE